MIRRGTARCGYRNRTALIRRMANITQVFIAGKPPLRGIGTEERWYTVVRCGLCRALPVGRGLLFYLLLLYSISPDHSQEGDAWRFLQENWNKFG